MKPFSFGRFLDITLVTLCIIISCISCVTLYAAADGHMRPWALAQIMRFMAGLCVMFFIALSKLRFWMRSANVIYVIVCVLLVLISVIGSLNMGARRWLRIGGMGFQPAEIMKIALVLVLARFFHMRPFWTWMHLMMASCLIFFPFFLILKQPDLGTAIVILFVGISILWHAGLPSRVMWLSIASVISLSPFLWHQLHAYQKKRILMFLDPTSDPLGAGYHVLQSQIALGSGGMWGKGFLKGTQSSLGFVPEKHTDFIFALFAEEHGFVGSFMLLVLYIWIIWRMNFIIWFLPMHTFQRYVGIGMSGLVFSHIIINIGMVIGLLPVVGIPLPFMSYGGTSVLTMLTAVGFICLVKFHAASS